MTDLSWSRVDRTFGVLSQARHAAAGGGAAVEDLSIRFIRLSEAFCLIWLLVRRVSERLLTSVICSLGITSGCSVAGSFCACVNATSGWRLCGVLLRLFAVWSSSVALCAGIWSRWNQVIRYILSIFSELIRRLARLHVQAPRKYIIASCWWFIKND